MIVLIIIVIVRFIIAGIIVCLNKSHRLCMLICADVISTTLAVCSAWQATCITATPLVCTWRSWFAAASNTLQNWRWCNGWSTFDWGQDIIVKLPTILRFQKVESTQYPGVPPDRLPSRWEPADGQSDVLHCSIICWWETLYLGWVFFLLNIEHLRSARDVIPLPPYSLDR